MQDVGSGYFSLRVIGHGLYSFALGSWVRLAEKGDVVKCGKLSLATTTELCYKSSHLIVILMKAITFAHPKEN
jgi:hypothetical protein